MFPALRASSGADTAVSFSLRSVWRGLACCDRRAVPLWPLAGTHSVATGMMGAVCRLSVALAGLVSLAAVVVAGTSAGGMAEASVTVRTVVGPGVLDGPGGIALGAG